MTRLAVLLLAVLPALAGAADWIFVTTATKVPLARGTNTTAFEAYADGFDPNVNTPFGPDKPTMFLPVTDPAQPALANHVTEKLVATYTLGSDGRTYRGKYVAPDWVRGWDTVATTLDEAKSAKLADLFEDYTGTLAAGYVTGAYTLEISDQFLELILARQNALQQAITAGIANPTTTKISLADQNDQEAAVTIAQLNAIIPDYFANYMISINKEVKARASIIAAETPAAVDAVAWSF